MKNDKDIQTKTKPSALGILMGMVCFCIAMCILSSCNRIKFTTLTGTDNVDVMSELAFREDDGTLIDATFNYKDKEHHYYYEDYKTKTFRRYVGKTGDTAHITFIIRDKEGNELTEFTDLGCLGLIEYKGQVYQEIGCYADKGIISDLCYMIHSIYKKTIGIFIEKVPG